MLAHSCVSILLCSNNYSVFIFTRKLLPLRWSYGRLIFFVFKFWANLFLRLGNNKFLQSISEGDVKQTELFGQLPPVHRLAGAFRANDQQANGWRLRKRKKKKKLKNENENENENENVNNNNNNNNNKIKA